WPLQFAYGYTGTDLAMRSRKFDAQRAGGQQAQTLQADAGSLLVGDLHVVGKKAVGFVRLQQPAIVLQDFLKILRRADDSNMNFHGVTSLLREARPNDSREA